MKGFIYCITIFLMVAVIAAAMPTETEAAIYEDTVRLHILANSDSESDQAIKYEIRDLVLEKYSSRLSEVKSAEDAKEKAEEILTDIENEVNIHLGMLGVDYTASIDIGKEWYDTRKYDDFTLPKGIYTSLIIKLGNAEGQNWWCVMYPPMCLGIATEKGEKDDALIDYSNEETRLISDGEYQIKFKLLEIASEIVAKISKNS